jgi:Protein of unknown function (DUF2845)
MKTMIKMAFVPAVISLFALPASADMTFRCKSQIVEPGQSEDYIRGICGEPTETRTEKEETYPTRPEDGTVVGDLGVPREMHTWKYNMGPGDYVYILTFLDKILFTIETGGRGD